MQKKIKRKKKASVTLFRILYFEKRTLLAPRSIHFDWFVPTMAGTNHWRASSADCFLETLCRMSSQRPPALSRARKMRSVGLLSLIRHAKVPHGLSRQIIRARSAKRQSDLAIVIFVRNTIATKNPHPIVMWPTMKRPTLFSCPSAMTPNATR